MTTMPFFIERPLHFFLLCALPVSLLAQDEVSLPENYADVEETLLKIVEGRSEIKSGHFRLTVNRTAPKAASSAFFGEEQRILIDLWFHGDKQKVEKSRPGKHLFILFNGHAPDTTVYYNPAPSAILDDPDVERTPFIAIYDSVPDPSKPKFVSDNFRKFDPQRWGMLPEDVTVAPEFSLEQFFSLIKERPTGGKSNPPKRCNIQQDSFDGAPCHLV